MTDLNLPLLREAVADIPLPLDGESLTSTELTKIQIQKLVRCVNAAPALLDEVEQARCAECEHDAFLLVAEDLKKAEAALAEVREEVKRLKIALDNAEWAAKETP